MLERLGDIAARVLNSRSREEGKLGFVDQIAAATFPPSQEVEGPCLIEPRGPCGLVFRGQRILDLQLGSGCPALREGESERCAVFPESRPCTLLTGDRRTWEGIRRQPGFSGSRLRGIFRGLERSD